jgi:hypothetical protein
VDLSHKVGRDGMNKADRIRERHVKSFTMKTLSEHIHIRTGNEAWQRDHSIKGKRLVYVMPEWDYLYREYLEIKDLLE